MRNLLRSAELKEVYEAHKRGPDQCCRRAPLSLDRLVGAGKLRSWLAARRAARANSYSFTLIPASLINFAHCGISDLIIAAISGPALCWRRSPCQELADACAHHFVREHVPSRCKVCR